MHVVRLEHEFNVKGLTLKSTSRCHTGCMSGLRIGEVANQAGVSTATIRYYERAGLVPIAARSEAGYRLYSQRAVEELAFIRRAQVIGFSLDEIRGLLQLSRGGVAPCDRVIALAGAHLEQIEERIRQLQMFRDRLASALTQWRSGDCGFSSRGLCNLLDVSPPRFEASASLAPENVGFNRRMRATASPRRRP